MLGLDIVGPTDKNLISALVDSGSDHNMFSLQIAKDLALPLGEKVTFDGFGASGMQGYLTNVTFQIEFKGKPFTWKSKAIFSDAADRNVLGQHGFFDFFTVTFNRRDLEFEINPY